MVEFKKPDRIPQIEPTARLASSVGFSVKLGQTRTPFSILTDFDSIRDNLTNILFFRKGDYPDNPDFGVGLQDYVFEPNDEVLTLSLDQEIRRQVNTYEPRATVTYLSLYQPEWIDHALVADFVADIAGQSFRGVATSQGNFTLYALGDAA